ncbi:MAG: hypothetical protein ACK4UN_02780 [Limisphaerales bacterium]
MKNFLVLLFASLSLVGCTTGKITNLTPSKAQQNAVGLYPVEMAWQSREQALIPETIQPQVLVGAESYPMQRVPLVRNRWETLIPVTPGQDAVYYRFKVDYLYRAIPEPRKNSVLSPEYKMEIAK